MKSTNSQYLQFLLQISTRLLQWNLLKWSWNMDKDTVRAVIQPGLKIPAYSLRNRIIYFQPSQLDFFCNLWCDFCPISKRTRQEMCSDWKLFSRRPYHIGRTESANTCFLTLHKHILLSCHCHAFVSFNGEVMMKLSWYANSLLTFTLSTPQDAYNKKNLANVLV